MTDIDRRRDAEVAIPAPRPPIAADTSYEIELGDPPPPAAAELVEPVLPAGYRRPIVPAHLRTRVGLRKAAGRQVGGAAHRVAFHGLRCPGYLFWALWYALVGLLRIAERQLRWWWVHEQTELRSQAVVAGDSREWSKLHKDARDTRQFRGFVLLAEVAGLFIGAAVLAHAARWWALLALVVLVPVLARAGRPADRHIFRPAVVTPRFRRLSADIVLRAYYAAGLGRPDKPGQEITFGSPMARDGEGSRVLVDLPYGKGLDDAVKAKPGIASGLDVQVSQVFLHRDPTSHRRHALWVADRDPLAVPVGRTPLLACRPTDIWKPAPLGLDERGQLVTVPLMWNSVLVSALPRAGKTFSARLLALYAALDPYVRLDVFDFKGSPDWRRFALVADSFGFGMTPTRDGLPLEIFGATLLELKADVQDRYTRLSELAARRPDLCPEGKLTRELARDPRFGMPVRVLVMDEFQEVYDIGDAKEVAALLTFLVKVAPGAGVILVGATQRPSGVGSGQVAQQFVSFRDNFAVRFGLRTSSWQVSELCLGAGAYSEGLDTSTLLPQYKGVGILRGASDVSPTVRTYLADGQDAERILTAARSLRERAGTLSGMAAGQAAQKAARDVLADVLAVFGSDPGLHWQVLAERLARQFPERWADATGESVSADVRALGVPSADVKMAGRALKGCRRADVERVSAP